ncbi:MAG: hypothetical protein HQ582_07705 [Planctomycetes bacterium]|nr:hypothetical protein [Planctomycetota bacterium]
MAHRERNGGGTEPARGQTLRWAAVCCFGIALMMSSAAEGQERALDEFFQELFLGESVYPQESKELQFTTGFLWRHEGRHDHRLPVLLEYGITDRFQVALELPVDWVRDDDQRHGGVGNIELETYWNFLNNPSSGWAAGVGFGLGFPAATDEVGDDAYLYEPFFVAYRQVGDCAAFNVSAGLEIEDPRHEDETEVAGEVAAALIRRCDPFVLLLEAGVEIETDETPVRLAPGVYWQPDDANWEIGVSLPIGLSSDAPDIGVFALWTVEFGGDDDRDNNVDPDWN